MWRKVGGGRRVAGMSRAVNRWPGGLICGHRLGGVPRHNGGILGEPAPGKVENSRLVAVAREVGEDAWLITKD